MTDFSGDNLSAPNGVPTTKSPPPFPPRGDERPAMSREPAAAAPNPAAAAAPSGPSLAATVPAGSSAPSMSSVSAPNMVQGGQGNGGDRFPAEVRGRIDVADEV